MNNKKFISFLIIIMVIGLGLSFIGLYSSSKNDNVKDHEQMRIINSNIKKEYK